MNQVLLALIRQILLQFQRRFWKNATEIPDHFSNDRNLEHLEGPGINAQTISSFPPMCIVHVGFTQVTVPRLCQLEFVASLLEPVCILLALGNSKSCPHPKSQETRDTFHRGRQSFHAWSFCHVTPREGSTYTPFLMPQAAKYAIVAPMFLSSDASD